MCVIAMLLWVTLPAAASEVLAQFSTDYPGNRQAALCLARRAFDAYCLQRHSLPVPSDLPPALRLRSGVFVSAMADGAPRCCMGTLYPTQPTLAHEIVAAARAAAAADLRFPPIRPDELPRLRLIVSIVAPPEAVLDPWSLDPLVDGVAVRSAMGTGVSLPGESPHLSRLIDWARVRSRAEAGEPVSYFRVRAVRIVEPADATATAPPK